MSVAVVVKVSEGVVLAADSAAAVHGRIAGPGGVQQGVVKTYYNAKKLMRIGDFPMGVLTWGQAYIGARTIESLVREWEHNEGWQSQKQYQERKKPSFSVEVCAEGLHKHIAQAHDEEFASLPEKQRPGLGMVVAGYSQGQFFPEIWRFFLPLDDQIHNQRPDRDGKPDFGASWFGLTDAIVRLHWGRDENAIKIISEKFDIPEQAVFEALQPLQYPIPFAVMPLQDAIEYASYVVNVVIGRFRFVLGVELCGGEIDIAAITQREFHWISKKSWKLE